MDDDWYKPHHSQAPAPTRVPRPGEPVWTLVKGRHVDCELRFHCESYAWEVQFHHDRLMAYGQRLVLRAHAEAEAEAHRLRLMADG